MIHTSESSGVLSIVLDRPARKNALTPQMLRDFTRVLAPLGPATSSASTVRAILVRGEGDAFCSGFDLSLCRDDASVLAELLTTLYDAIFALRVARVPVVVAAHGAAIAGGCALLCGADFVVTNAEAKLGYPVVRLGISPAVNAPFLLQAIGDGPCRRLLLEGSLITGAQAAEIGLASHCVDQPADVLPRARQLAADLAAKPPAALSATRQWLAEVEGSLASERSGLGLEASVRLVGGAEERERLAALWRK